MNYKSFDGFIVAIIVLGVAATTTAVVRQNITDSFESTPPVEALNTPQKQREVKPSTTTTFDNVEIKPKTYTVHIGESFRYNNTKITFVDVAADSRCPIDVVCVWAGEFVGRFTLEKKNDIELLMVKNTSTTTSSLYQIHINNITPLPVANKNIAQKDYKVTISIGLKK